MMAPESLQALWHRRPSPTVDPVTIGISFIDILFALAIGVALQPVQSWARDPSQNPLPSATVVNMLVVIFLILGSFVGYHNSTNRPRFRIRFVNVEFFKFTLDVCMVVLYFILASFAANQPPGIRAETLIVSVVFGLYALWDLAGLIQRSSAAYRDEWCKAYALSDRPTLMENWTAANPWRMVVTLGGLVVSTALTVYAFLTSSVVSTTTVVIVGVILIVVLFLYRVVKDFIPGSRGGGICDEPEPDQGGTSVADEITKFARLRDQGLITSEEYEARKARLLA